MKLTIWTFVIISTLIFISPLYSLYKIGVGIKEKDKEVLNEYILWKELQKSVKKDVKRFIKKRAKERKEDLDNPIEGIFEDIKIVGEKVFGGTALDIAIKKIITADGVIKLVELSERKKNKKANNDKENILSNQKDKKKLFNLDGYSVETFNFNTLSDFQAKIITPDGDIFFKMKMIFPRWHLYSLQSDELSKRISRKVEDSVDLLKNLREGYENK